MKVCPAHPERPTPLIFTFAFPGAEHWCPHCGFKAGIFEAGPDVVETDALLATQVIDKRDDGPAMTYLRAYSAFTCSRMKHDGHWIDPKDMPADLRAYYNKVVAEWKYPWPLDDGGA